MSTVFSTTICQITPNCTRRAPSAKLRRIISSIEPEELRQRMMQACEKCSKLVVEDFCSQTGNRKCARCYRMLEKESCGAKLCALCMQSQRERQRRNYAKKRTCNDTNADIADAGFQCTHCSAIIPPDERRRRPRGKPGWVQKCETCLQRNREVDARRRGVLRAAK